MLIGDMLMLMVVATLGLVVCSYMLYQFKKEVAFMVESVTKVANACIAFISRLAEKRKKKQALGVAS